MNRVLAAAGVAAIHSHADQGQKWKPIQPSLRRLLSGPGAAAAGAAATSAASQSEIGDDRSIRTRLSASDDSLRQAMYMNCWGQN